MPRELVFDTAAEKFIVRSYDLVPLGSHEVQVHLELAAPKHGTEAHAWVGRVNRGRRWDAARRLFLEPLPDEYERRPASMRVGNMAVGVVTAVGSAVENYQVGDRVYGYMPVREIHHAPVERLTHLPADLTPEAALCLDPAHVALIAVRDGKVRLGDDVAVFGLGAIGLLTVQAARASGALRVVAIDPLASRRERAQRMGADVVIDPRDGDTGLSIKDATQQQGVDVALETSGADPALHEAIRCIRQCGTVVGVGWGSGTGTGLYLGEEFHVNRPTIVASQASSYWGNPDRDYPLWDEPRAQAACAALFCRGLLSAQDIIDPIVDLSDSADMLRAVLDDPGRVLKVGIRLARSV